MADNQAVDDEKVLRRRKLSCGIFANIDLANVGVLQIQRAFGGNEVPYGGVGIPEVFNPQLGNRVTTSQTMHCAAAFAAGPGIVLHRGNMKLHIRGIAKPRIEAKFNKISLLSMGLHSVSEHITAEW